MEGYVLAGETCVEVLVKPPFPVEILVASEVPPVAAAG
jgi:hypothetical protein